MAGTQLADAYVQIVPSMKGVQGEIARSFGSGSGLDREAAAAGKRSGSLLSVGLVGGLAGLAGGAAAQALSSIVGSIGGYVKAAAEASDDTDKFKQTLQFAGFKPTAIAAATAASQKYADQTVYDLGTIQSTTAQLAANGVKNYTGITEAAGNLNAVAGGNAETFKSVGLVLTQTAGAGKLTTENYNQLAEAIPGASGILQEALKKNGAYTGNFRDAMEKGQISAAEFNKAILQVGSKPVAVEAAKSTTTFEGAIGSLQATITGGLASALNAIKPVATGAISAVSDGLGGAFKGIGNVVQAIGPPIKAFLSGLGGAGRVLAPIGAAFSEAFAPVLPIIRNLVPQFLTLASSVSPTGLVLKALLPVLPQLAGLLGTLASTVGGTLSSVLSALLPVVVQLSGTLVKVGTAILSAVLPVVTTLVGTLAGSFQTVLQTLLPVLAQVATVVGATLGQALTLLTPLLITIVGALGRVYAAVAPVIATVLQLAAGLLAQLLPVFVQLVQQVLPPVISILGQVIGAVTPLIPIIASVLVGAIKALLPIVQAVFGALGPIIKAAVQIITGVLDVVIGLLTGNFSQVWRGLGGIVSGAWNLVVSAIRGAVGIVGAALGAVVNIIGSVLGGVVQTVISIGGKVIDGFVAGAKAYLHFVVDFYGGIITTVLGALSGAATWLVSTGGKILGGLLAGAKTGLDAVVGWLGGVVTAVTGALNGAAQWLVKVGVQVLTGLLNGARDGLKGVTGFIGDIEGKVLGAIGNAASWLLKVGGQVMDGLVSGIRNGFGNVTAAISRVANLLPETVRKLLGIASPSKVFTQLGLFVTQGLVKGMAGGADAVKSSADTLVQKVTDSFSKAADNREAAQKRITALNKKLVDVDPKSKTAGKQRDAIRSQIGDQQAILRANATPKGVNSKALIAGLRSDNKALDALAVTRDQLADSLKKAQDDVTAALKTRDDFRDSVQATSVALGSVVDSFKAVADARSAAASSVSDTQSKIAGLVKDQASAQSDVVTAQQKLAGLDRDIAALDTTADGYADKLADLQDKRTDAASSLQDQLTKVADVTTQIGDAQATLAKAQTDSVQASTPAIIAQLQQAVTDTKTFQTVLAGLRGQGLDQTTYSQLLAAGVAGGGLAAAQELAAAGPGVVQQVADLQTQLSTAGAALGTDGAQVLYQAGVDTAQGVVAGIQAHVTDNQAAIALMEQSIAQRVQVLGVNTTALTRGTGAQITAGLNDGIKGGDLSDAITDLGGRAAQLGVSAKAGAKENGRQVTAGLAAGLLDGKGILSKAVEDVSDSTIKKLKKRLGIKSPSRVARAEIGQQLGAGMALGITDMHGDVERAAADLASIPTAAMTAAGYGDLGTAPAPIVQNFNGPMGLTRDEVADTIATKGRRAITGVNIQRVRVA